MKTVAILSGGLDSTVMVWKLIADRHKVKALGFNYGQRHVRELLHAREVAARLGIEFRDVDLTSITPLLAGSALTSPEVPVPDDEYKVETIKVLVVPNRNMIMLAVATGWATSLKYDSVSYAAHAGDHEVYPDCRPEFTDALGEAIRLSAMREVNLLRPFVEMSKAEIVRLGHELGVPFELTWSCYKGDQVHCGTCPTCVERKRAFRDAQVTDPTEYLDG